MQSWSLARGVCYIILGADLIYKQEMTFLLFYTKLEFRRSFWENNKPTKIHKRVNLIIKYNTEN